MKRVCVRRLQANAPGVVYCGRGCGAWRGSALGNPFKASRGFDNAAAVASYRRWLWEKIQRRDAAVMQALAMLDEDSVLGCWCADDEACHTDVIMRAWAWCQEQGLLGGDEAGEDTAPVMELTQAELREYAADCS